MIFLTTGTQLPFDRIVQAVDTLLEVCDIGPILAQGLPGAYCPKNFVLTPRLQRSEFESTMDRSKIVIGHAGIGTIIACMERGRPFFCMPREMRYREHRNDHQLATLEKFGSRDGIYSFKNSEQLVDLFNISEIKSMNNDESIERSMHLSKWVESFFENGL